MDKRILYLFGAFLAFLSMCCLLHFSSGESFDYTGKGTNIPDGNYYISSAMSHLPLTSNIIDTIQCNDFLIGQTEPSETNSWQLKRVAGSVYILFKNNQRECLYSSPANEVRSFFFEDCVSPNLCGAQSLDYRGELDSSSLHSYFMILQHPRGAFYIKNMKNGMFLEMTQDSLRFVKNVNKNCLFNIRSV